MFYQNELSFLKDILKKSNIDTFELSGQEFSGAFVNPSFDNVFNNEVFFNTVVAQTRPRTLYRVNDIYERSYRLLVLPEAPTHTVLCIGPFLSNAISKEKLFKIGEDNGISPHKQKYLLEYYSSLTILSSNSPLLTVINTFCERIWATSSFSIKDVNQTISFSDVPVSKSMQSSDNDTLLNIKALERRYAFENDMIRAVSLGLSNIEIKFNQAFSNDFFEKRNADPVKNAKNYCIIMNTLLRKAAEKGGVHPLHLDQISSEFAKKIDNLNSQFEISTLMAEMFKRYCNLVRKRSVNKYSPVVQKTILIIDTDISCDLSPSVLAFNQGISLGYLSNVFKKETGKTLSEYIREKRINYAKHLINTTNLQIQTIALHCGVMDLQYFSKLFKKQTGKTPTEYKRLVKNNNM